MFMQAKIFPKTGTASLQFLKIGVDARAIGMGEAYTAVSDDISSMYWNPAGLAKKMENQVMFSHTNWVADINQEYLAACLSLDAGMIGISANVLHMPAMDETSEEVFGPTGREFNASDMAFALTYANMFTDKFTFGTSIKYLRENLADESVNDFAVDLGTLYNTGWKNLTIGMALRNFGPDIQYKVDNDNDGSTDEDPFDLFDNDGDGLIDEDREEMSFKIPMQFSLGIAADIMRDKNQALIASMQVDNCVDREETWNIGAEYTWKNFALRSGYQMNYDAAGFSAGFGVRVPSSIGIFNVDYAYTDMGDLEESFAKGAHRISIKVSY